MQSNFEASKDIQAVADGGANELAAKQQMMLEREIKAYASRSLIIPSCSAWFNIDQIHELEM